MRIVPIAGNNRIYSSNVYLVLGEWNHIDDVNTLIDVGNDPSIIDKIGEINTGFGKNKVEQVILTHSHSDHTGILPLIKKAFHPKVYAFSPYLDGVDRALKHGDTLQMGESMFTIFHTPGHSSDSITLFNREQGILFVGDTQILIRTSDGGYSLEFYQALECVCREKICIIYPGHGKPLTTNIHELMMLTLRNVRRLQSEAKS